MEKIVINARDGYELELHIFSIPNSKSVIQLIHGMEEHQERYENFIKYLNNAGFTVVSSNMRGHGTNAECLGFFKEKFGYIELVEDQKLITDYIRKRFSNLPIYILAHSMGTIITRVLLQENSKDYEKVVLSGYPNYQNATVLGLILSNIIKLIHGPKYKSKLLSSLSIGKFNKSIKDSKTDYDWICYNEKTVEAYINDPYCGIGFTCSAFGDLFNLVLLMHKSKLYKDVNENMDILLLRGLDDPCIGGNRGAKDSYSVLLNAGFKNIVSINYPNMRHEILAEEDNKKVFNDILKFYNNY